MVGFTPQSELIDPHRSTKSSSTWRRQPGGEGSEVDIFANVLKVAEA
jgi:hypothetical protein